jgi:hypothetical protein
MRIWPCLCSKHTLILFQKTKLLHKLIMNILRKIISKIYRRLLPGEVQKVVRPFMDVAYSFVHRIYSICLDIYPSVGFLKENRSQNNINLSLFIAGRRRDSAFLLDKMYHEEPKATKQGRFLIWKIPSLDKSRVDVTLIEADQCFSRFFSRRGFFVVPEWVLFTMDISVPIEKIRRQNKSSKSDFRNIWKYQYEYEIWFDKEKLHFFYHTMYLPYISSRYGKLIVLTSLNQMEDLLQKGELLLVKRGSEYVSGMLIYKASPAPIVSYLGVKDGRIDLVKQGALSALYYYVIVWAKGKGYTKLDFGHSRPILNDGVFLYKKKLGMGIQRSPRSHRTLYLSINRFNSYLEQFFADNPLVHEDRGELKGLLFVQRDDQSTRQAVEVLKRKYSIPGLEDFTVVFPDGTTTQTSKQNPEGDGKDKVLIH